MFEKRDYVDKIIKKAIKKTEKYKDMGELASYIPELANVDPNSFAFCLVTVEGEVFSYGEIEKIFSIQSISKVLSLIMALRDNDPISVFEKVGSEPTSYEFNSLVPITDKATNPFINAGAMTTASMVKGANVDEKFDRILSYYKKLSSFLDAYMIKEVYESEMETTDRNRAIAYYLKSKNIFSDNPNEVLDLYIRNCSIATNVCALAKMGAVLANKGNKPNSKEKLLSKKEIQIIVSQMATCGMYENSGRYLMEVGIPSKSGVSGGILGVVPGVCGLGVYSPKIDKSGNSIRGIELFKILANDLGFTIFIN